VNVAAADAAQAGLPAIGLRLVHTGLGARVLGGDGSYVGCSGPPGVTLSFSVMVSPVAGHDEVATRAALHAVYAKLLTPPRDLPGGTLELAGAARPAAVLELTSGRITKYAAGALIATERGTLLVVLAVGSPLVAEPTVAAIAAVPELAGCVRSLALDGVGAPAAWSTAAQVGAGIGAPVPPRERPGGPTKVGLDQLAAGLATASLSRALGALFGLAVGDALGTTNEFKPLPAPAFPTLATGPVADVIGGGPFGLAAGEVTDDTQMAACLADAFAKASALSPGQLAARYLAWRSVAFDVGVQISQCLELIRGGDGPELAGRRLWEQKGRHPAGNGALMRTAVIGVMFAGAPEARRQASWLDAAITHFDPRCLLACAAYNASIGHALTERPSPASMVRAAEAELAAAADELRGCHPDLRAEIDAAERALAGDLAAARDDDPELYGDELHLHRTAGFVRVAFRLAYWELLHAADYASAVIDATNRGGDADTNAAIVGGLWGALVGIDGLPRAWVARVLTAPALSAEGYEFGPRAFLPALARGFAVERNDHAWAQLAPWIALADPGAGEVLRPASERINVDGAPIEAWWRGDATGGQARVRGADGMVRIATLLSSTTVAEPEPPGVPLSLAALPLRGRHAVPLAIEIFRACERVPGIDHVDPTMIYVRADSDRLVVSGLLVGSDRFAREHDPAARWRYVPRALLCAAPEVLAGTPPYLASATFSCAAVLLYPGGPRHRHERAVPRSAAAGAPGDRPRAARDHAPALAWDCEDQVGRSTAQRRAARVSVQARSSGSR
jgi:ADP-ribosyl-[dinitrogen reductase] hydrolase